MIKLNQKQEIIIALFFEGKSQRQIASEYEIYNINEEPVIYHGAYLIISKRYDEPEKH